ncbi:hypothetical protein QQP08_005479 [Theobroma cacao]|nr:hypothetical protein QQP08_005479 [Theobroma cacao]
MYTSVRIKDSARRSNSIFNASGAESIINCVCEGAVVQVQGNADEGGFRYRVESKKQVLLLKEGETKRYG